MSDMEDGKLIWLRAVYLSLVMPLQISEQTCKRSARGTIRTSTLPLSDRSKRWVARQPEAYGVHAQTDNTDLAGETNS